MTALVRSKEGEHSNMPHKWTDEDRQIIRRDYAHTHASAEAIAKKLGVTVYALKGQVALMGIAKRTNWHPWAPEDDRRLKYLLARYNIRRVAVRMHRSINSVVARAKRIHLHRRTRYGWYTKTEVCEILAVDHHWLQRHIDSGALKATYHNGRRPTQRGLAMWHINKKDLTAFLRRYPGELTGRNVDLLQIVDILAGLLPVQRK